jgi:transmembrane sensor
MNKGMNETNYNKVWELKAANVHGEASKSEKNELKEKSSVPGEEEINNNLTYIDILKKATPLHPLSSLAASWDKVAGYFRSKKIQLYLSITKYAAIIMLAFLAGTLISYNWKPGLAVLVYSEIIAPGQITEMTLYDGTHVSLNSGTALKYAQNFGHKTRSVEFEGEAFFKVTSRKKPFKVKIKNHEVKVHGWHTLTNKLNSRSRPSACFYQ